MFRAEIAERRVFESWQDYQDALKRAIAPLTAQQLQRRIIVGMRTPGELAQHIVFGRAFHLQQTLGQEIAALQPLLDWDNPDNPPHTAEEIVAGLNVTWEVIANLLMNGPPNHTPSDADALKIQTIWGLIDHDLPHAGELSLLLGANGLAGVEI